MPYFYKSFPLTKDSFPLTNFFYVTKHWKMWKTIFIEGFPAKQTERKIKDFVVKNLSPNLKVREKGIRIIVNFFIYYYFLIKRILIGSVF